MSDVVFSKARKREFRFAIGSKQTKRFILKRNGEDLDSVSGWTWEFVIQDNKGSNAKKLSLTLGNGISYEAYSSFTLVVTLTAAQTAAIGEGKKFAALWRTDIPEPWVWGDAHFGYGFDSEL